MRMKKNESLSPERRKAAMLRRAKSWLSSEKKALQEQFMSQGNPETMLRAHADLLDALLAEFYSELAGDDTPGMALVAVGGYGRHEMYPYSDVDILFLYDDAHSEQAARFSELIVQLLWDLKLKVGHAYRSLDEAVQAAKQDMTIRTSLLDSRIIAGDGELYRRYRSRFEKEVIAGSEAAFIEAKLAERGERHKRFGASRYMLEPNVKEGKGGLRDLHTLWWLATYVYPIRSLDELVGMGHLTADEYRIYHEAQKFLQCVRIHLHYLCGRPEERLGFDVQLPLSQAMGYDHPNPNTAITRFMRRYFIAVRTVGSVTRQFCTLLEEAHKRAPRNAFTALWQNPWKLGAFKLAGQRLLPRQETLFARQPAAMLELFRTAQQHGLDIHPRALQQVARNLKRIDKSVQDDPRANQIFLDILLSPKDAETTLRRMSEAGVLGRFIPDFGRVIGMTQFNRYHIYTVDEHTLVALGVLHAIEQGELEKDLPLASEVIHRVRMKRVLYVALLCHDIAKGRGGDHSLQGEAIARRLCRRFGFAEDEAETTAWLVRHHLLLSHTVFKRDVTDPKTIQDFVREVQHSERLKLLLVLTVADMRAVAPGVWNHWKGALMRDLYYRAQEAMGAAPATSRARQDEQFSQRLAERLPDWPAKTVAEYVALGNAGVWTACDIERHALIARMLHDAQSETLPLAIHTEHHYEHRVTDMTLVAADQHGLFSKVAGAMALAGANITGAKIFTLKNGMAVELFQVQDLTNDVFDAPDKLAKMSVYIRQVLAGELDLNLAFGKRQRDWRAQEAGPQPITTQVFVDNEASDQHTVIELTGRDRPGFLYQVTRAMADLGLSIGTAHISTFGLQAADVFYVKDQFGMKITHEAKLKTIRETLIEAVAG